MKTSTYCRSVFMTSCFVLGTFASMAQFAFTNSNALFTTQTHSGCAVTVVDVNNDGLDDMLIMDQSSNLVVRLQNRDATFTSYPLGQVYGSHVWGMAAADVDHNGWKDVVTGSGDAVLVKLGWNGTTVTSNITSLTGGYFVQNVTFGDFNNDGWADVAVDDDNDYAKVYINDGAGNLLAMAQSFTTLTIGTGSKSLTVPTGLNFTNGQTLMVGYNGANYMTGTVTSYNSATGALVMNITAVTGSGSFNGWSVHPNVILNTNINPGLTIGNDPYDSGNYGGVWTDIDNDGDQDLYIAHCRQSASSSTDVRRRDRLFINNGNNTFTEGGQSRNIEVTDFKQTWTTSFGDIDNDGDQDIVMTNHGENGQILKNDGTGHFTDISTGSGFSTSGFDPIESMVEDFDNDGYLDILVSGGGNGNSYLLYHNNHDYTFTLATLPFAAQSNGMLSFGTGDLNHDGKADIFASYGNVYNSPTGTDDVLYFNSVANGNHFITFALTGTVSNIDALGAKVTIYGPWGVQVREVRSGESYGTSNSTQCHFGIGANTVVDSAMIEWPSHQFTNHFTNLAADQFVTVIENGCAITGNVIPGPFTLCTGQTVTLTAVAGYTSYGWSNGDNTQSSVISTPGSYNVMVTDAGGCTGISPTVEVVVNPDETPTVSVTGELVFCAGGSVTLTSSVASSYAWSSGETSQSITVSASGIYTVSIQGLCAAFSSDPSVVNVLAAPLAVAYDDSAVSPNSITLNATGNDISWYDSQTGGILLGTGPSYTTPVLINTTTYWVENATSYGGGNLYTGQAFHTGTSFYTATNTNRELYFDVLDNCVLQSVKVYTDMAGDREIQIFNSTGTLLHSLVVNIPVDSSVVTLNFALTPGTGLYITTNTTVNNSSLGFASPELQRSSTGMVFPYTINNVISVTGSSSGYYYYFYDWNVVLPATVCSSARIPVQAIMLAPDAVGNFTIENNFSVYPNPADENVTVSFNNIGTQKSTVEFVNTVGQVVSSASLENAAGNFNQVFDISGLAKGVYTIHVISNDKTSYQQLIIQ
ncbi:MAG: FG-GAP-like repeat-containing protein [Bacteroidota bacterium]